MKPRPSPCHPFVTAVATVLIGLLGAARAEASPPPCPLLAAGQDCVAVTGVGGAASMDAYGSFPYGQYPMQPMPASTAWTTLPAAETWHLHIPAYNTVGSVDFVVHDATTGAIVARMPSVGYSPALGPGDYDLGTTLPLPGGMPNGAYEIDVDVNDSYYYVQGNCCGAPPTVYSGVWTYQVQKWLRVDSDPPQPAPSSTTVEGDGWHASPSLDVRMTKPTEDPATESPIDAVRYELCPATDRGHCGEPVRVAVDPTASAVEVSTPVPRAGDYLVKAWFEDSATNNNPLFDNDDAHVRYDAEPPQLGFVADDPSDPTDIEVQASDATSGIGGGEIDYQPQGSTTWHEIPTTVTQSRLSASFDDSAVRKGAVKFRAVATDLAGNAAATSKLAGGGGQFVLSAPLRQAARLGVSLRHALSATVRRCHRSKGRRRCTTSYRPPPKRQPKAVSLSYGRTRRIRGLLTTDQGRPLSGAPVKVTTVIEETGATPATTVVHTNARGQFTYRLRPGPSRRLSFVYSGAAHVQPVRRPLRAKVRAATTFHVARTVKAGHDAVFHGQLKGGYLPAQGALVDVFAIDLHVRRQIGETRTDDRGNWIVRYRILPGLGAGVTYQLYAVVPSQPAYPWATGRSRIRRLTVRP